MATVECRQQTPVAPTTYQPASVTYLNRPPTQRTLYTVQYSRDSLSSVKWVSGTQMVLGVLCVILEAVSLSFNDRLSTAKANGDSLFHRYISVDLSTLDEVGNGIWVGALMVLTAMLGIASWKQNSKGLIIPYLVFSLLTGLLSIALMGTEAEALDELTNCRRYGSRVSLSSPYDSGSYWTTPTLWQAYLLGEHIGTSDHTMLFHCTHPMFSAWIACDAIMLGCALVFSVLSLMSLVYSSKAACGRCCHSYCGCCGADEDTPGVMYELPAGQLEASGVPQVHQQPLFYPVQGSNIPSHHPQPAAPTTIVYPPYQQPTAQAAPDSTSAAQAAPAKGSGQRKMLSRPGYTQFTNE